VQEAGAFASKRGWNHWELRGGTKTLDVPAAVAFHGHTVALDPDPAVVFERCDSAVRRAVRKAAASDLTIQISQSMESMRAFHTLFCKTRQRHGLPPQPWRFFENIQRHVLGPRRGCIVLASRGSTPIAGAIFFHFGKSVLFKFGASDAAYQHLRPNNLVMWRAIEWHARAGFSALDLGRTSLSNEGLRRFKLSWGAQERRMEYARFDCQSSAFVTTKDRSSGWHSSVFKIVPQSLARLIGALAYKHVA
jgi:lipid II:glycine glycyltransferase (peptidoglycan interpeptide bridge formation enzyme)